MKEQNERSYRPEFWERLQLFKDCIAMKKPKRIPLLSCFYTWKILDSDSGYKLSEAMANYDVMERVVCEFHERYQFDAYNELGTRNMVKPFDDLGSRYYIIDDEKEVVNYYDHVLMEGSEYKDFAEDPKAMYWKMFLRRFPNVTKGQMVNAIQKYLEFRAFAAHMSKKFIEEYHCPATYNFLGAGVPLVPFEAFFQHYRGIRESSLDVRKHKSELKEAMDKYFEIDTMPKVRALLTSDNTCFVTDIRTALLGHSVLSPKQFEELYWPYMKQIIDETVAAGRTINIFAESSIMRLVEYFQDIPKGHVLIHPELDDVIGLRKELPNICICGGMKSELLGYGTPEECVAYAKHLVEEIGEGYIFSQNKMMSFRNDCKRENLLAVNEFVRNYRC